MQNKNNKQWIWFIDPLILIVYSLVVELDPSDNTLQHLKNKTLLYPLVAVYMGWWHAHIRRS